MSSSIPCLTELPVETLEQTFLCLPGQDIIKMEVVRIASVTFTHFPTDFILYCMTQVCQKFRDLIQGSPMLQHRRELFVAGLMENPHNPCDLAEGRHLCKEYVDKWSDPTSMMKCFHEVPLGVVLSRCWMMSPGRNLLAVRSFDSGDIYFIHVPPAISRNPIEEWNPPPLQSGHAHPAVYLPKNVIALAKVQEG